MDQDKKISILAQRFPAASRDEIVAALKKGGNMNVRASKILLRAQSARTAPLPPPVPVRTVVSEPVPEKTHKNTRVRFREQPRPTQNIAPVPVSRPISESPSSNVTGATKLQGATKRGRKVRTRTKKVAKEKFRQAKVVSCESSYPRMKVTRSGMKRPIFKKIFQVKLQGHDNVTRTFSVRSYIGDGISGQIYIATDITDGAELGDGLTKYALKVFTSKKSKEDRELTLLKQLNVSDLQHPHIIGIKYFSALPLRPTNGGYGFIMLELARNGELFDYVANEPFDESYARHFMRQILSAVEYLHRRGIVHRDLKPENFLVDSKAALRICDFGHAKVLKEVETCAGLPSLAGGLPPMPKLVTTKTKAISSGAYKAPILQDRLSGSAYDATKVDVWEIGVALFVMVAQDYPFGQDEAKMSKDEIDKVLDGKDNAAFWQEVEARGVDFSLHAKAFLNRIFTTDAAKRADVGELSKMVWVTKGAVPSQMAVIAEMRRRAIAIERVPHFN